MKKYLQKLGQNSYKASLEKVDTHTKNRVLLKFSYLLLQISARFSMNY